MGFTRGTAGANNPNDIVRNTIQALRKDFLSLLRGESNTFTSFLSACANFDAFAQSCHESLDDETLDLLYDFSTPLAALSSTMAELSSRKNQISDEFATEINGVLSDKTSLLVLSSENTDASRTPSYIEPCARWLKNNCHNPYPSSQMRAEIAVETGASTKDIDAWFIDARKRIGWNDLRRKHFGNKRVKILQAASVFFNMELVPSESDVLDPHIEGEFAAILGRATALYDQKFAQSKLADKLDVAVRDMTPTLKEQLKNEKARKREKERGSRTNSERARHAYPSPERSPASVAEVLASPPATVVEFTLRGNSPTLGSKRRRSLQSDDEISSTPLCKRPRSQSIRRELSPEKGLPSPAASTQEELSEFSAAPSPQPSSLPQFTATDTSRSTGKRKRRLSDGFQHPAAKRPQIRPQTVSDPFPTASGEDWDQWFREHVLSSPELTLTGDIPPPVTVDAPDSNAPLDIQLFNFPLIPDLPPSAPAAPTPAAELNVIEPLEVPAATQVNVDPEATTLDQTFSWMANDFPPPLQPTNTFPSSTSIYVHATPLPALDVISQSFPDTQSSAFLHDPSLWSNISNPDLDFSGLFGQCSTGTAVAASIQVPSHPMLSTSKALSEQEREAKRRELEELEARAQAIRAEISAP
uniref:Mating-type protein beta 1 n=1 Tax=Coprinopsis cinerea TaxID=5346 RepID=Q9UR37_COPCI|nr:mating-type protein beta 1 [Coprinopsis cinerea]AAD33333.1 mating-type protein beta 1 [Coprinopsis cinerea]AAD33334.1 mating-type protein beta 1 [Coprinopsis cinerea]AAD33335.1 mating-type protein beta 1 [Coprinopsis cinerea]AAD33336.1 mating-type protein beta 1 [Coprinopsis cinerea]